MGSSRLLQTHAICKPSRVQCRLGERGKQGTHHGIRFFESSELQRGQGDVGDLGDAADAGDIHLTRRFSFLVLHGPPPCPISTDALQSDCGRAPPRVCCESPVDRVIHHGVSLETPSAENLPKSSGSPRWPSHAHRTSMQLPIFPSRTSLILATIFPHENLNNTSIQIVRLWLSGPCAGI